MPGTGRKKIEIALLFSFVLSGAAALIAQNVWQRELLRLIGATTPAASVIYAGVMTGLGAGALLGNFLLTRRGGGQNALRLMAMLEAICAAFALAYVLIFQSQALTQIPWLAEDLGRFFMAFVMAILPSVAMGATWPAAVAAAQRISTEPEFLIGWLYAANLDGAVLGVFAALFLIPNLGLWETLAISGSLNICCCIIATWLSLAVVKLIPTRNPIEDRVTLNSDAMIPQYDCVLVFLAAFVTFALEVTWTRLITLFLGSSTYSVAVVLLGTLTALCLSSRVFYFAARFLNAKIWAATASSIAAVIIFAEACGLNRLPEIFFALSKHLAELHVPVFNQYLGPRMAVCALFVMLPIIFTSAVFPALMAGSLKEVNAKTLRAGWLYSASTLGAVSGALVSGMRSIPFLAEHFESGLQANLFVCAGVILYTAGLAAGHQLTLAAKKDPRAGCVVLCAAALMGFSAIVIPPYADRFLLSQGIGYILLDEKRSSAQMRQAIEDERKESSIVFYREGLNSTVTVQEFPKKNVRVLKNDGKVEAAIPMDMAIPAPTSDYPTQLLLGCLPYVMSGKSNASTLVIGCGSGATYGSLRELKSVGALAVAEIEKAVYLASEYFFREQKRAEKADVRKVIGDARNFLEYVPNTFDLIVSQPAEPWVNGAGDLYTKEFFKLVSTRLAKGGIFCQWLQLYSIDEKDLLVLLNTIQSAFPNTYVFHPHGSGEILIVCFNTLASGAKTAPQSAPAEPDKQDSAQSVKEISDEAKLDVHRIKTIMGEPALAAKLQYCHIASPADLLSMLVLTPQSLDELLWKKLATDRGLFNTDNNLRSEYSLPQQLLVKDDRIEKNLELLHTVRSSLLPCLKELPETLAEKAEFLDRVALSMAGFSQKHPGEGLDEAALAAAYEAWTLRESQATAAACDVVSYMTGRFPTGKERGRQPHKIDDLTAGDCFWLGQAEALKGNEKAAREIYAEGFKKGGPQATELRELLEKLAGLGLTSPTAGSPIAPEKQAK